jgi:hypothetical protein
MCFILFDSKKKIKTIIFQNKQELRTIFITCSKISDCPVISGYSVNSGDWKKEITPQITLIDADDFLNLSADFADERR